MSSFARFVARVESALGLAVETDEWRKVEVEVGALCEGGYCDNSIKTAKYSLLTFLPRSLFEQFRRTANQYFLLVAMLMILGTYTDYFFSPLAPFSTIAPLCFILGITMAKEGGEDLKRHRSDEVVNSRLVGAVSEQEAGEETVDLAWRELRVGQLVVVKDRQDIPADLVVLASSETDSAYVETSNIDGETNLKIKRPLAAQLKNGWTDVASMRGSKFGLEFEQPNGKVHTFNGTFIAEEAVALDHSHLLLRGSTLRNTRWVVGVIVYTGRDTRLARNARDVPSKLSELERAVNAMVLFILGAMVLLTTLSTLIHYVFNTRHKKNMWYLCYRYRGPDVPALFQENCREGEHYTDGSMWFTFFILYNNFIPISLYVTIEIINYVQAYYIDSDRGMYDAVSDTPALARTSNMNADLGMIGHIFSDKTGTLTRNVMTFKRATIAGTVYANEERPPQRLNALKQLVLSENNKDERDLVAIMAVCHTVVPEEAGGVIQYEAESPDEEALVKGARDLGVEFLRRKPSLVSVGWGNRTVDFELLVTIPFDSTRKRMSVIVRTKDGIIRLMSKGADSIMFGLAASKGFAKFPGGRAQLDEQLESFAGEGLRTLVLGHHRDLTAASFQRWYDEHWHPAETTVGPTRAAKLSEAAELVEKDLVILGATAIEDKLQDGVPETIAELAQAGIKLWVLTGDKMATAINVAYSAKLLTKGMFVVKMPADGSEDEPDYGVAAQFDALESLFATAARATDEAGVVERQRTENPLLDARTLPKPLLSDDVDVEVGRYNSEHLALVIEGSTALEVILASASLSRRLYELCQGCRAVVACRVSPAQKRLLVALTMRESSKGPLERPVTLAVGDGANDVGMIQEAQIGVGISGKEGRQAVNNSDFAIAQFRFLKPLLLEHGRRNYRRNSKVIIYSFFKNIVLTLVLFYYQSDNGWSAQSLYESWVYSGYNFFLGLLPLAMGFFDADVLPKTINKYPALYASGLHRMDLNVTNMAYATFEAICVSLVVYYVSRGVFESPEGVWSKDGKNLDMYAFGTAIFVSMVIAMTVRAGLLVDTWTWVTPCFLLLQLTMLFTFIIFMAQASVSELDYGYFGVASHLYETPVFWLLGLALIPGMVAVIQLLILATHLELFPSISDIGVELDHGYLNGEQLPSNTRSKYSVHELVKRLFASFAAPSEEQRPPTLLSRDSIRNAHRSLDREQSRRVGLHDDLNASFAYDSPSETLGAGAGPPPL